MGSAVCLVRMAMSCRWFLHGISGLVEWMPVLCGSAMWLWPPRTVSGLDLWVIGELL